MNIYDKKTAFLHKLNSAFAIALSTLLTCLAFVIYFSIYDYRILLLVLGFFLLSLCFWWLRESLDMSIEERNKENYSIIYPYIRSLVFWCFLVYITYTYTTLALTMMLVIALVIEILLIFVIIYRYKIRKKIIALFKKKK